MGNRGRHRYNTQSPKRLLSPEVFHQEKYCIGLGGEYHEGIRPRCLRTLLSFCREKRSQVGPKTRTQPSTTRNVHKGLTGDTYPTPRYGWSPTAVFPQIGSPRMSPDRSRHQWWVCRCHIPVDSHPDLVPIFESTRLTGSP